MDNPFKKIEPEEKPPEHLKSRVMQSAEFVRLVAGTVELFSVNAGKTFIGLFGEEKKSKEQ